MTVMQQGCRVIQGEAGRCACWRVIIRFPRSYYITGIRLLGAGPDPILAV